ncbi:hypothetical protein BH20VER3_BH20VER3_10200 [soil metagenome]
MAEFRVIPLAAAPLGSVTALLEKQLLEHGVNRSPNELVGLLQLLLAQPSVGFVLVAVADTNPIGFAYGAAVLSLEHGGRSGWLEELYVLPEWRGCGAGSALLNAVVARAQERGWAALDLEVDGNHARALPLYARNRFTPVHRTRFVRRLR